MKKFLCISGKAQSGKDTTGLILKEQLEQLGFSVLLTHQADLLKYICKTYFGWNGEKDDKGRTLLQQVGTDVIRKQEPDFWVNFLKKITDMFPSQWDFIIIPDTRFPNEIYRLLDDDSIVKHIRVVRPNYDNGLSEEQQKHPSETALDNANSDYTIINDGNEEDLKVKLSYILFPLITEKAS